MRGPIVANSTTAPDGMANADLHTETTANGAHGCYHGFSVISGNSYTVSVFARRYHASRAWIHLQPQATAMLANVAFNLATQAVSVVSGAPTAPKIERLANDRYRLSVTVRGTRL